MVLKWEVAMKVALEGLKEIRPVEGWESIDSYFIMLKCELCGTIKKCKRVSLGRENILRHRREANHPLKCKGCPRTAGVFINKFGGGKIENGNEVVLMELHADGLQPEEGFLEFTKYVTAVDDDGNESEGFNLTIGEGPAEIFPQFGQAADYRRRIRGSELIFRRV